jgi:hypothetical protein
MSRQPAMHPTSYVLRPRMHPEDVPAALWPADNPWEVPVLDLAWQAGPFVDAPFVRWGSKRRKDRQHGTWHFYTDDYRFTRLLQRPQDLVNSRCVATVEPDFSIHAQTPRAEALHRIFQRRSLARLWQAYEVRIIVNLNVAERHADLVMLGVPHGWRTYATRGSSARLAGLEREHAAAVARAGTESITFIVYGGGRPVAELAQARGWLWFPEELDEVHHGA